MISKPVILDFSTHFTPIFPIFTENLSFLYTKMIILKIRSFFHYFFRNEHEKERNEPRVTSRSKERFATLTGSGII